MISGTMRNLDPEAGKPGREASEVTDDEQLECDVTFGNKQPEGLTAQVGGQRHRLQRAGAATKCLGFAGVGR